MTCQQHCGELQFKDVCGTDAFQQADREWPFESWDDGQWKKVVNSARKELTSP